MATSTPKPQKKDTRGNKMLNPNSIAVYVCAREQKKGKDESKLYRFVDGEFDSEFKTDTPVGIYKKKLKHISFYSTNDREFTMHIFANPKKVNLLQAKPLAMEIAVLHKREFADLIESKTIIQSHVVNPNIVNKSSEIGNLLDILDLMKSKLDYMYRNKSIGTYKEYAKEVKLWYWTLGSHIDNLDK
jgi:hypothetical protein